jgi:hypothetical protein
MARPALVSALAATLLAAAPVMARAGPSEPDLLPLPATVTALPLTLAWPAATFSSGSLERRYEIRLEDRTSDTVQVVAVPAPTGPGTVTASVGLVDGHAYRMRVRSLETICPAEHPTSCKVEKSGFGKEQRTSVFLAAQPAPPQPIPVPVEAAPTPPVTAAPLPVVAAAVAPAADVPLAQPPPMSRPRPRPPAHWVAPAASRRLDPAVPIRLRWRADRRATFYNVQVFAGRRKILSVWPTAASLTLRPGTLRRGSQRIVVWSASGPKVAPIFERTPWVVQVLRAGSPGAPRA